MQSVLLAIIIFLPAALNFYASETEELSPLIYSILLVGKTSQSPSECLSPLFRFCLEVVIAKDHLVSVWKA